MGHGISFALFSIMAGGRPPKYKTAEELQEKIQEYFDDIAARKDRITITGLCLWLGFESRQAFYHLENNEKFCYTIKKARMAIESHYEKLLQGNSVTGAIFALKNFGWIDKQHVEQTIKDDRVRIVVTSNQEADALASLN